MFPFKKKTPPVTLAPAPETTNEHVRRRLSETDTRLGEAVRKMEECLARRSQCAKAPLCPNFVPAKVSR